MKEKEVIKTFLEWYNKSEWDETDYLGTFVSVRTGKDLTTDQLIDLYEHGTKQYRIEEVWDETNSTSDSISWNEQSFLSQKNITAFAERYHQLKKEGRIKP